MLALIVGLAISGFTSADPGAAAHPKSASSTAPATAATPPALCIAEEPAQRHPFPFNRDYRRRDALLQAAQDSPAANRDMAYVGGTADFYSIDVGALAELITDR